VFGFFNRNFSHRDQYAADMSLYVRAHEIKLGGDYTDGVTDSTDYFTGGQAVQLRNEWGVPYYRHAFFAKSPTDLTPAGSAVARGSAVNTGAYLQDSWRVGSGWTVNAGLRWDEEAIHDYSGKTILRTSNEWQPRLGVIWDPEGHGRTKVFASLGRFYYALPTDLVIRSFGNRTTVVTFNFDPVGLAQNPAVPNHSTPVIQGGASETLVDVGLKGGYQDELTVGIEKLLDPTLSVALKGIYRRLGRAIEDRCDLDYNRPETNFNSCAIVNPGSNGPIARGDLPGCNGLENEFLECGDTSSATPPARRLYRGIELSTRKSVGERLWLQASYVYSSLRGNYDGGVSAIERQTDPGSTIDFDYPIDYHNSYGRLYLDRPHGFRLDGYYATPFKLFVGFQGFVQSGAPESRYGYSEYGFSDIQLVPRGTDGRLPTLWEASLLVGYPFRAGPATVTVQLYVYNLFNNQIRTSRDDVWSSSPPPDYPVSLFNPNQERNNPNYGKGTSRQEPRSVRGSLRVSF
jgi:hypothetical protein